MPIDLPIGSFPFDYAWVFFALASLANTFWLKARIARTVRSRPELEPGCSRLFKGMLVVFHLPWLLMGAGMLIAGVPSTYSYLFPRHGGPYVWFYHAFMVILSLLGDYWIYFRDGAEFLFAHQDAFSQRPVGSALQVRLYAGLTSLAGVLGLIFMWSQ